MSQAPYGPPAGPAPWPGQDPSVPKGPSRLPVIIAIAVAVVALAVAIAGWFRPAPRPETPAPKAYSEQEVADAKKAVCEAFGKVNKAVVTTMNKDGGTDPAAKLAVAANARLAVHAGGQYLSEALAQHPATPHELAAGIRDLAMSFEAIVIDYLGELPEPEQAPLLRTADDATVRIKQKCE